MPGVAESHVRLPEGGTEVVEAGTMEGLPMDHVIITLIVSE